MQSHYRIKKSEIISIGLIPCILIEVIKEHPKSTKEDLVRILNSLDLPNFDKVYEDKVFSILDREEYRPFKY